MLRRVATGAGFLSTFIVVVTIEVVASIVDSLERTRRG